MPSRSVAAVLLLVPLALPLALGAGALGGVSMSVDPHSQAIDAGATATYSLNISNSAVAPQTLTLTVTGNFSANWTWNGTQSVTVPGGGSVSSPLQISTAAGAVPATYNFSAEARDVTGALVASAPFSVVIRAPPAPTSDGAPPAPVAPRIGLAATQGDSGSPGDTVRGALTITDLDSKPGVTLSLSIAGAASWHPRLGQQGQVAYPGESYTIPLFVTVPDGAARGEAFIVTARIDGTDFSYTARWPVAVVVPPAPAPASDGASQPGSNATPPASGGDSGSTPAPAPSTTPQYALAIAVSDVSVTSGESAEFQITLWNNGTDSLHVTLAGGAPSSDWKMSLPAAFDLAGGETRVVRGSLDAPAGLPGGGRAASTIVATTTQGVSRPGQFTITTLAGLPVIASPTTTVPAAQLAAPASNSFPKAAVGIAVGFGAVGAGALVLARRPLREKLLWAGIGLYTRLAKADVLGHPERDRLYKMVESSPGVHFHALQRELGWNTGTLTYHLRVLEKHGMMVSRRDGLYRRFYLQGAAPRKETFTNGPQGLRADVLEAIRNRHGMSQSDLALLLGANKQTVNYHVKALEKQGLVRLDKVGRETFLYPTVPGETGTSPAPA